MAFTNTELIEFSSIKKYLDLAIGKKKSKVSGKSTLEQKIKSVNISQYLRGIKVFFEYSELFNDPSEIIAYWKKYRDNDEKIQELYKEVDNYVNWLKKEKQLSDSTIITYQAHIRGYLSNNNINLKFKNYKPKTRKRQQQNKLGITYEELKEFALKVKEYIKDFDLRLLVEFLHRTGLAYKEIADITFGILRAKNYDEQEYNPIANDREKSSVEYTNFISPDLKPYVLDYLRINKDKKETDKLFGNDTEKAYQNLHRKFNTAYEKCCENHYPRFLEVKTRKENLKRLFSLHSFRSVFISACQKLRIPEMHINLFVAHTGERMTNYDLISDELLEDYKLVENELFGKKSSENATINEVFDILKDLVQNKGKRKAIFRKYNEDPTIDLNTEIKGALFLEQMKYEIIKEVKREIINDLIQIKESNNEVLNCSYCGKEIKKDQSICSFCGISLN